jgi:hypothetical protein
MPLGHIFIFLYHNENRYIKYDNFHTYDILIRNITRLKETWSETFLFIFYRTIQFTRNVYQYLYIVTNIVVYMYRYIINNIIILLSFKNKLLIDSIQNAVCVYSSTYAIGWAHTHTISARPSRFTFYFVLYRIIVVFDGFIDFIFSHMYLLIVKVKMCYGNYIMNKHSSYFIINNIRWPCPPWPWCEVPDMQYFVRGRVNRLPNNNGQVDNRH